MRDLNEREINIAKLLQLKVSNVEIANKYGCSTKTIQRMKQDPRIMAYMASLKGELDRRIVERMDAHAEAAATAVVEVVWNFNMAAKNLTAIVDDPQAKDSDKISAIKLLNEQYGISRAVAAESTAPKPDIYQSAWMKTPEKLQ